MTVFLSLIQAAIFAVLCANNGYLKVRLFTVALVFGSLENAVYAPGSVDIPLHVATGIARLLACAEAIWLLVRDGPRRSKAVVGLVVVAMGGFATFIDARMQFNLQPLWMWRGFGIAWACGALGGVVALLSNWRWLADLTPQWTRYHACLYIVYATDKTVFHFTPLQKGQGPMWEVLWGLHFAVAACLFIGWLALFAVGHVEPYQRPEEERDRDNPDNFVHGCS